MKRIYAKMVSWLEKNVTLEKAIYALCILVGIVIGIWGFVEMDKTPATEADYVQLEERAYAISEDPQLIFRTNGNAVINNGKIKLTLENSECKIVTQYDSDFNLVKIKREDKSILVIYAILLALLLGCFCTAVTFVVIIMLMFILVTILFIGSQIKKKINNVS